MTDLMEIVSRLEESGGTLILDGDRIRYSVPKGDGEAQTLLAELRKHREIVKGLLRRRVAAEDAKRHFGQPHAKLFPFIGRKVKTPAGIGTLIQVFAGRVTVVLESNMDKCTVFEPAEIEPVSWQLP